MRALLISAIVAITATSYAAAGSSGPVVLDPVSFRVGALPAAQPFDFAVLQRPGFEPERIYLWAVDEGATCTHRAKHALMLVGGPPTALPDGRMATRFTVQRLPFSTTHCVALEGLESVADTHHATLRAGLVALVERHLEPNPPLSRAARRSAVDQVLGPLASVPVRCTLPGLCAGDTPQPVGAVINRWIEDAPPFITALQISADLVATRQTRADALQAMIAAARTRARTKQPRAYARSLSDPLNRALDLSQRANLHLPAQAAVHANGLRPEAQAAQAALQALMAAEPLAWASADCTEEDRGCRALRKTARFAHRAVAALDAERAGRAALDTAIARFDEALTRWTTGRPLLRTRQVTSPLPGYTQRLGYYVSGDLGLAMPFFGAEPTLVSFIGINFYFAPVDKDRPMDASTAFRERFSLTAGLTLGTLTDAAHTVQGSLGGASALAGVGYRLTDYARLGVGAVLFRQADANPTVRRDHLRLAPYWALSVDLDVAGTVKGFYTSAQ
jgi:hypothetical protein